MRKRMASLGRDTEMELERRGAAQVGRDAVERTTQATSRQHPFQAADGTSAARCCLLTHISPFDLSLSCRMQRAQEERREERRWRRYGKSEHYHHHGVGEFAWHLNGGGNRDAFGYYAILSLDPTSASKSTIAIDITRVAVCRNVDRERNQGGVSETGAAVASRSSPGGKEDGGERREKEGRRHEGAISVVA